jgi:MFS family permease
VVDERAKPSYAAVLRLPSFALLFAASFLGRTGIGMIPLTLILLVQYYTGSFEWAGYATAGFIALNALSAPLRARFIDAVGHRLSLVWLAVSFTAAVEIVALVAVQRPHPAWLVLVSGLAGCVTAPVGGVTRVLFARIAPDPALRQRAYGVDAVSEEVSLSLGPLLAVLAASLWNPVVALHVVGMLCLLGVSTLAFAPSSRRGPDDAADASAGTKDRRVLGYPGFLPVLAVLTGTGVALGFVYVGVPIAMSDFGSTSRAGLALAVFSAASATGGILYGARKWRIPPGNRILVACLLFAIGTLAVSMANNALTLCLALGVAGLCVAPILISGYLLVDALTPMKVRTMATTWANTVANGGISAGSALVSFLSTRTSTAACFVLAAAVVVVVAAVSSRWRPAMNGTHVP